MQRYVPLASGPVSHARFMVLTVSVCGHGQCLRACLCYTGVCGRCCRRNSTPHFQSSFASEQHQVKLRSRRLNSQPWNSAQYYILHTTYGHARFSPPNLCASPLPQVPQYAPLYRRQRYTPPILVTAPLHTPPVGSGPLPACTSCGTIGTRSHSAASSASARSLSFSGLVRVGLGSAARLSARVAFQLAASTAFTGIPR